MRWLNYLRPDIKRGNISPEEDDLIIRLHSLLGNRWSLIAGRLPGRTDNEIKNYWKTNLSKSIKSNTGTSEQKRVRESRKRTFTSPNKRTRKKKEEKVVAEDFTNGQTTEPARIHFPKAVKVSPLSATRNVGSPSMISNGTARYVQVADHREASLLLSAVEVVSNNGLASAWATDSHGHDYDSSSQNHIPEIDEYLLDDIFEKCQQLLQDDDLAQLDFVDSVLA